MENTRMILFKFNNKLCCAWEEIYFKGNELIYITHLEEQHGDKYIETSTVEQTLQEWLQDIFDNNVVRYKIWMKDNKHICYATVNSPEGLYKFNLQFLDRRD